MKSLKYLCLIPAFTISSLMAGTSLPYIGPDMPNCTINDPMGVNKLDQKSIEEMDGGVLANEDCNIIYVRPPRKGIIHNSVMRETQLAGFCDLTNMLMEDAYDSFRFKVKNEEQKRSLTELLSGDLTNEQREQIYKDRMQAISNIELALKLLKRIKKGVKEVSGGDPVATYAANISLEWNKLIKAYRKSNPGVDFRQLPISIGLLSASLKTRPDVSSPNDGLNVFQEISADPVIESRAQGIDVREIGRSTDLPFPDFVSGHKGDAVLMGQSSSLQLLLNGLGYCAIKDKAVSHNGTLQAYLAPTYTYFYPIQTKAIYKIKVNKAEVKRTIKRLFKEHGSKSLTTVNVLESMPNANIEIVMNSGLFGNGAGEKLRDEYEEGLKVMVINEIMARASEKVEGLYQKSHYTVQIPHTGTACATSGRWFWKKTVCHNYTYYVSEQRLDSAKFDAYLTELVERGGEGQVNNYINHIMFDTSSFSEQVIAPKKPKEEEDNEN